VLFMAAAPSVVRMPSLVLGKRSLLVFVKGNLKLLLSIHDNGAAPGTGSPMGFPETKRKRTGSASVATATLSPSSVKHQRPGVAEARAVSVEGGSPRHHIGEYGVSLFRRVGEVGVGGMTWRP